MSAAAVITATRRNATTRLIFTGYHAVRYETMALRARRDKTDRVVLTITDVTMRPYQPLGADHGAVLFSKQLLPTDAVLPGALVTVVDVKTLDVWVEVDLDLASDLQA